MTRTRILRTRSTTGALALVAAFGASLAPPARGQARVGDEGTFRGNRAEISITVRDRSRGREQYEGALKESAEALNGSHCAAREIELLVAQAQTAVGRYEECAQTLRTYLKSHPKDPGAATARRWLDKLAADGKIKPD